MKESGSGNRVGSRQIVHAARLTLVYLSAEVNKSDLRRQEWNGLPRWCLQGDTDEWRSGLEQEDITSKFRE